LNKFPIRFLQSSSVDGTDDEGRQVAEEQADGSVSLKVWISYFRSGGNLCLLFFMLLVLVISQAIISGSDYFVSYWTNQEDQRINNMPTMFTTMECLYIYGVLIIAVVLVGYFHRLFYSGKC
jgi:ATP-binding cassette, subfamily C (CFTR/MRP), member 4